MAFPVSSNSGVHVSRPQTAPGARLYPWKSRVWRHFLHHCVRTLESAHSQELVTPEMFPTQCKIDQTRRSQTRCVSTCTTGRERRCRSRGRGPPPPWRWPGPPSVGQCRDHHRASGWERRVAGHQSGVASWSPLTDGDHGCCIAGRVTTVRQHPSLTLINWLDPDTFIMELVSFYLFEATILLITLHH